MDVIRLGLETPALGLGRPVATIGNFDGLHLGHRKIVGEAVRRADGRKERAAVVTFDPHPVLVLHPGARFCRLRTLDDRLRGLSALGVSMVAIVRFDAELKATSPQAFVERVLVGALAVSEVLVGSRFRFGKERAGDFALLEALGREHGFEARAVRAIVRDGKPVSSTRIREALAEGDVREAGRLLGAPYRIEGEVVRGAGRGKPLVFPTANLALPEVCLPAPGVYAVRAQVGGRSFTGASFLGAPETFGETRPVLETHLLEHDGSALYGERLAIELLARVRGPVRFASADELRAQIARDLEVARRVGRQRAGAARSGRPPR